MRKLLVVSLFVAAATTTFADTIDDAEAKRRGVPVEQVQLENQLEKAQDRIIKLESENNRLKSQISQMQNTSTANPDLATRPNQGPLANKELVTRLGIVAASLSENRDAGTDSFKELSAKGTLPVKDGIFVETVIKDSAAEKAGIHRDDIIAVLNSVAVLTKDDYQRAVNSIPKVKSQRYTISVWRFKAKAGWSKVEIEVTTEAFQTSPLTAALQAQYSKLLKDSVANDETRSTQPSGSPGIEISGAIWISRIDASSDVQRGIKVHLLPRYIEGQALEAVLNDASMEWFQHPYRENPIRITTDPDAGLAKNEKVKAESYERSYFITEMSVQMPHFVSVTDAYSLAKASHQFGQAHFEQASAMASIQSAQTNVDGKYTFSGVVAGSYFIHAEIKTDAVYVDWLLPITVKASGKISQDLFNGNASTIDK